MWIKYGSWKNEYDNRLLSDGLPGLFFYFFWFSWNENIVGKVHNCFKIHYLLRITLIFLFIWVWYQEKQFLEEVRSGGDWHWNSEQTAAVLPKRY